MEISQQDHLSQMDIQLDGESRQQLLEASKWSKFIAIIVFVACGLFLLFGILSGASLASAIDRLTAGSNVFSNLGQAIIAIIAIIVLIVAFVYYFLLQFAMKVKSALSSENPEQLAAAIRSLKTYFIITTVASAISVINALINMFI